MKKFVLKSFMLAFPILFGLVWINYIGDGAKLFDKEYEKDIVEIIADGKYVTNIKNFDERLFQEYLIKEKNNCPNVMVTGSSRTMLINSNLVADTSFMNNSVSGASIEDIVSIYQLYKEQNKFPSKVIIGIDPWTFNENNDQKRWQSIANSYYRFHKIKKEGNTDSELEKYKQLISFTYFQSSIKCLPEVLNGTNHPVPTDTKFNSTNTRLTDGSLIYGEQMREASEEKIEDRVQSFIIGELYGLENFDSISGRIWNEFDTLIKDMKKYGVEIEFFLAPYHPEAYKKIKEEYPIVLESEAIIIDYAKKHNINIYGSFDPDKIGLNENHFYDGMHCKEKGIELILKS